MKKPDIHVKKRYKHIKKSGAGIGIACLRGILIIAGLLLLINALYMAINANFNAGILFAAAAGLAFLLYGLFLVKLRRMKWLHVVMTAGILLVVCMIAFLAVYGRIDTVTYEEDALIVLGAAIRGETPSYPLYARLEAAADYHLRNPGAVIVVSGGQGFQENITEALAMERHLLRRGVPADRILKEERATSSYENFQFSLEILDQQFDGDYQLAFVTSDFHVFRASVTAKSLGLATTHCHAPILWYTLPTNYLRECAAVLKELLISR